ncbi:DUF1971 domain-containing protein [uncultured Roseobacter sp.]|uniref:DUF1971 domain-containing protein n=1 Tax=uncultured Roseobacter sp. TaxID=114847 RepID=UPI0026343103|nr:DUF1971 domain-containing protein [uncultured Roseobacter sp.]
MTRDLPETVEKYSQSPVFTQDTIPAALQRDHNTKPSVWGLIVVSDGALIYTRNEHAPQKIPAGEVATIYPEEPHHVAPDGEVRFQVEFYREPAKAVAK